MMRGGKLIKSGFDKTSLAQANGKSAAHSWPMRNDGGGVLNMFWLDPRSKKTFQVTQTDASPRYGHLSAAQRKKRTLNERGR